MISKRLFDLFFSLTGLLLLLPVFLPIAIWIRLDSPGPVFFRQVRVGQFGNPFRIFKFRTMYADAEARGNRLRWGRTPASLGQAVSYDSSNSMNCRNCSM